MPPKNIESYQLYVQTPEGYETLNSVELVEIESTALEDFETFKERFLSSMQTTINAIIPKIREVIQILSGDIKPYMVHESQHPRKKPRGSIRRRRRAKCQ